MWPRLLSKQLPAFLARLRKTDVPSITSDSISIRVTEELPAPLAPETTSSPLVISADSSGIEATSSSLVKKYEIGSGENKVNVRIYKEPLTKPIIAAPHGMRSKTS